MKLDTILQYRHYNETKSLTRQMTIFYNEENHDLFGKEPAHGGSIFFPLCQFGTACSQDS